MCLIFRYGFDGTVCENWCFRRVKDKSEKGYGWAYNYVNTQKLIAQKYDGVKVMNGGVTGSVQSVLRRNMLSSLIFLNSKCSVTARQSMTVF